jgi:TonB family protein
LATIKTTAVFIALSAILSCCCSTPPAFSEQSSQPDKNSIPTIGQGGVDTKAPGDAQSKATETDGIYKVGGTVLPPKLIHSSNPKWTCAAKRARMQGNCTLSLIVDAEGKPQNFQVVKAVGMGMDENAVEAMKKYRF